MVFVTAILQDACLSIKVANKTVYLNFHVTILVSIKLAVQQLYCHFLNMFFHQGGQQPG